MSRFKPATSPSAGCSLLRCRWGHVVVATNASLAFSSETSPLVLARWALQCCRRSREHNSTQPCGVCCYWICAVPFVSSLLFLLPHRCSKVNFAMLSERCRLSLSACRHVEHPATGFALGPVALLQLILLPCRCLSAGCASMGTSWSCKGLRHCKHLPS